MSVSPSNWNPNDNQGKRYDQVEFSNGMVLGGAASLVVLFAAYAAIPGFAESLDDAWQFLKELTQ